MKRETQRSGVFTRRALLMMGGQVAVLGTLAARLYQVQVDEGARYATLANENRISARMMAPPRGRVLDRFGVVLAGNSINWRAELVAEESNSVGNTLDTFAAIIPLNDYERARIDREVHRHRKFIPILIKEFLTWEQMALIEVNAPTCPVSSSTTAPGGSIRSADQFAHIVGYVAPPNEQDVADDPLLALPGLRIGRSGMEKFHDLALRGRAGSVQLEVNAVGRVIRELDRLEGVQGDDVGLTIDAGLQQSVLRTLKDESASAVVMDCRNGEVLAMATNPSFDPSLFNSGVTQAQWSKWTQRQAHAADQQGDLGPLCAGIDVQDGGGAGRPGEQGDQPLRPHRVPRLLRPGRCALPLLAQGRPWLARPAGRPEEQLRCLFLRNCPAHRHRPDRRDVEPPGDGCRA